MLQTLGEQDRENKGQWEYWEFWGSLNGLCAQAKSSNAIHLVPSAAAWDDLWGQDREL